MRGILLQIHNSMRKGHSKQVGLSVICWGYHIIVRLLQSHYNSPFMKKRSQLLADKCQILGCTPKNRKRSHE